MLPPLEEYLTGKTVMLPEVERAPVLTSAFTRMMLLYQQI